MTDNIRLIIAGSRDFNDYELLEKEVDVFLLNILDELEDKWMYNDFFIRIHYPEKLPSLFFLPIEIVSGGARGADRLGEKYAKSRNLPIKQFIPNWNGKGKSAGYIRNEEMAKYSNYCICFWNGSNGTKHMIDIAKKYKLGLKVINVPAPVILPKPKKYVDLPSGIKEEQ